MSNVTERPVQNTYTVMLLISNGELIKATKADEIQAGIKVLTEEAEYRDLDRPKIFLATCMPICELTKPNTIDKIEHIEG